MPHRQAAYEPGVKPYRSGYLELDYVPRETDLVCAFRIRPAPGTTFEEAAAAVAAESSVGTWTEVWSQELTDLDAFKARVYRMEGDLAYVAYPLELFEAGSMVNVMSSIVGNVFGFKAVSALRLEDMAVPPAFVEAFPGPAAGIREERRRLGIHGRPLLGGTVKPKLGLDPEGFAQVVYDCLCGGLDTTKDDENLNSQPFNPWRQRYERVMEAVARAEAETGEAKGHWLNVTAGSTEEMLRRTEYAAQLGSRYIMIDFITAGFAAFADVRKRAGELGLMIHCHRAMHAVFTRQPDHGINFHVVAKWARLVGADHLHVGTAVGKLEGGWQATRERCDILRRPFLSAGGGLLFDQDWGRIRPVFPVASGGIHVHHVPQLYRLFGDDAFWLFGGGTHGHPRGSRAGAAANRVATEAIVQGESLEEAALRSPELAQALALWSGVTFQVTP